MREIRTSGSEGGVAVNPAIPTPIVSNGARVFQPVAFPIPSQTDRNVRSPFPTGARVLCPDFRR
jgi:hypothetical protein